MRDSDDIAEISRKLTEATLKLAALTTPLAKARQVLSWESERRKNLLAGYVVGFLDQDMSASAAEARARAHPEYRNKSADLYRQSREAEEVCQKADATRAEFDAARSLLSTSKVLAGML